MKKNQLSKLALMGLATGAMIASNVTLSADTVTETRGTYLAGGCGGEGKCGGSKNRDNSNNYTADAVQSTTNSVVNPSMSPRPDAMQGSCAGRSSTNGQINPINNQENTGTTSGSCGAKTNQGYNQGSGSCASRASNNQGSGSCGAQSR